MLKSCTKLLIDHLRVSIKQQLQQLYQSIQRFRIR
ncbi:hypothetical protein CY0110_18342 [Crocosphaera chwakensis CCY0110]|uniref:Uncharacterized protein n=1 Tax=Crocosphaera chwakensis CCY0110 TaxID=391612 RepID=A3IJ00_9CHRO|nr:hypothetical protein CY0110_18342 [Crocosphaera chwakensis CCY0110]